MHNALCRSAPFKCVEEFVFPLNEHIVFNSFGVLKSMVDVECFKWYFTTIKAQMNGRRKWREKKCDDDDKRFISSGSESCELNAFKTGAIKRI